MWLATSEICADVEEVSLPIPSGNLFEGWTIGKLGAPPIMLLDANQNKRGAGGNQSARKMRYWRLIDDTYSYADNNLMIGTHGGKEKKKRRGDSRSEEDTKMKMCQ